MDNNDSKKSHDVKRISSVREIVYTLLTYIVLYLLSFLLLVLLIRLPLLKGINVLMYRGIVMIVIAGILASVLLVLFKKLRKVTWLSAKDVVLVFILTCSINMVFFTLIPVTVERSVSVFMLSWMDTYSGEDEDHYTQDMMGPTTDTNDGNFQNKDSTDSNLNGHFTQDQIAEIFVDKYVNEYGAFEKRFDEQLTTGSIEQNADGTYSITDKGRFIVKMFRLISDVFDTDKRLVEP